MWKSLADRQSIVEGGTVPGASQGVGQESGEENRCSMAEVSSQLNGQESWRQGVCDSPRQSCCTFKHKAVNSLQFAF